VFDFLDAVSYSYVYTRHSFRHTWGRSSVGRALEWHSESNRVQSLHQPDNSRHFNHLLSHRLAVLGIVLLSNRHNSATERQRARLSTNQVGRRNTLKVQQSSGSCVETVSVFWLHNRSGDGRWKNKRQSADGAAMKDVRIARRTNGRN
jgi:hypothetical protein